MFGRDDMRLRNELRHECELPPEDDILVRYIYSGKCVSCRRKMRRQLMLNESNARSKMFMKSAYVIRNERNNHLKYHYKMIHPFSNFRMVWETIMIVVFTLTLFASPFGPVISHETFLHLLRALLDLFSIADIIINFYTGYQSGKTNKIILNKKMVRKHYVCRGTFFFDLISSLPLDTLYAVATNAEMLSGDEKSAKKAQYTTTKNNMFMIACLKLFKIIPLWIYIERFREFMQFSIYKFKVFKLTLIILIVFMWSGCCVFQIGMTTDQYWKNEAVDLTFFLLRCFQKVLYMVLLFGSPESTKKVKMVVVEICILSIGFVIQLIVISQILQIVTKYSSSTNKYYQMTQQLGEFMRYKNLPDNIRKRILNYFDFRFQQTYYKEEEILRILSPQLRQEMLMHTYMSLLEKVSIFEDLPMAVLCKIINHMKPEIYLPSDTIITSGTVGDSMYFIATGTVAVYTSTGKEVCHLSDGANFGEIALIMENEQRVATVNAIDCCEVFILYRKDFIRQIDRFPEVYNRIRKMAQDRIRKTLIATLGGEDTDDDVSLGSTHRQGSKSSTQYVHV